MNWIFALLIVLAVPVVAAAQTQDPLIAGAKNEGRLVLYASAATQQLQMYMVAFNKRYPFIKTEYFRTDKQKLVTRVLLEEQTKQRIADLIHTSVIETHILKKRGALSRYVPAESASYPSQYKDPEGYWTSVYASGTLMGFNTQQVKRAEAPKTYEDLLNPRWKNNLGIDNTKIEWFSMLLKLKGRLLWKSWPRKTRVSMPATPTRSIFSQPASSRSCPVFTSIRSTVSKRKAHPSIGLASSR